MLWSARILLTAPDIRARTPGGPEPLQLVDPDRHVQRLAHRLRLKFREACGALRLKLKIAGPSATVYASTSATGFGCAASNWPARMTALPTVSIERMTRMERYQYGYLYVYGPALNTTVVVTLTAQETVVFPLNTRTLVVMDQLGNEGWIIVGREATGPAHLMFPGRISEAFAASPEISAELAGAFYGQSASVYFMRRVAV